MATKANQESDQTGNDHIAHLHIVALWKASKHPAPLGHVAGRQTMKRDHPMNVPSPAEVQPIIKQLERQMIEASRNLEFETAARLRDQILALQEGMRETQSPRKQAPKEKPTAAERTRGPNKPNPEAVAAIALRFAWWLKNRKQT